MICENCGKREANVKYSENINGIKKEMHLCEKCSKLLGITDQINFEIPTLDFGKFLGDFLQDFENEEKLPFINAIKELKCENCGTTFEDIINDGKYGCANCYDVFENQMDPILKKLQGQNRHRGRIGKITDNKIKYEESNIENNKKENVLYKLQKELKEAIKEEKYEEAAKIRDKIKKFKNENK